METFRLVVIGGGPGGYPAAIRAAQLGASVALVEKEELGGTCLNWGCIPTKTLISSSELFARMCSARGMGLRAEGLSFDYAAMTSRMAQIVASLRNSLRRTIESYGIRIFKGAASFLSRNRIAVDTANEPGVPRIVIGAERTIIASGATSSMPDFLPKHNRVLDSRSFLARSSLPSKILILGGGIIGCEFACMLAHLQAHVTVLELLEDILSNFDSELRRELRRHMERTLGIRILTGVTLEEISADDQKVKGRAGGEWLEGDWLLATLGRKPVTQNLKLENAGLTTTNSGFIAVDAYGRTEVATIYAVGDVTGGPQLAHAATSQGVVAAENACSRRLQRNENYIPNCVFTSPEIASVGLSEEEAQQKGLKVKISKCTLSGLGKALAMGEPRGFVKWVADAETGQLLGAHAIGPHAPELIAEATVALRAELTYEEVGSTVHAHPTLSEGWQEAARVLAGRTGSRSSLR
ncbi:MAG: dihydrolipoyl dehydrogenase [Terriglobia bacterium]